MHSFCFTLLRLEPAHAPLQQHAQMHQRGLILTDTIVYVDICYYLRAINIFLERQDLQLHGYLLICRGHNRVY